MLTKAYLFKLRPRPSGEVFAPLILNWVKILLNLRYSAWATSALFPELLPGISILCQQSSYSLSMSILLPSSSSLSWGHFLYASKEQPLSPILLLSILLTGVHSPRMDIRSVKWAWRFEHPAAEMELQASLFQKYSTAFGASCLFWACWNAWGHCLWVGTSLFCNTFTKAEGYCCFSFLLAFFGIECLDNIGNIDLLHVQIAWIKKDDTQSVCMNGSRVLFCLREGLKK